LYGFVDTIESAGNASLSINTIFNGITLDDALTDDTGSFRTLTVSGRGDLYNKIVLEEMNNQDGAIERDGDYSDVAEIIVKFKLSDNTNEGFRDRIIELKRLLGGRKHVLEFTDKDLFYYASLSELVFPEEDSNDLIGEMLFLCSDPIAYSKEEKTVPAEDVMMINNEGNEATEPIIELTATKKATFAMVNNINDEYNLLGFPLEEEGHEEIVDASPTVLYEDGTSMDGWTTSGVQVDDYFNDITGTMMSDGSGIRAQNYGTAGDRMRGPAVIRELSRPLQDFEITTNFDIISRREMDNFRIEVYFFDEAMNMLGKIGIKDNSRTKNRRAALGRVGPYRGAGRSNGYAIGKHNYIQDNLGETTLMNMSVKREGNLYTFYVARFRNSRHRTTLQSTFRDSKNEYDGRLRYISLFVGSYQDRAVPNRLRMNNLEVKEIRQLTVDQTPYILDVGDTVTFDHSTEEILINGQDAMMIKDFGAEFFKLPKGYSQIEINPPDTFTGEVKFREKYK